MLHAARAAFVPETTRASRHINTRSPVGSAGQSSPPVYSDLLGLTDRQQTKKKTNPPHTHPDGVSKNDQTWTLKQHICMRRGAAMGAGSAYLWAHGARVCRLLYAAQRGAPRRRNMLSASQCGSAPLGPGQPSGWGRCFQGRKCAGARHRRGSVGVIPGAPRRPDRLLPTCARRRERALAVSWTRAGWILAPWVVFFPALSLSSDTM